MKAALLTRYGPPEVLKLREIEKPIPKHNEILIKIYATTVSQADRRFRIPKPFLIRLMNGLIRPKNVTILGLELAGVVEDTGKNVKRFTNGDQVFAFTGFSFGAYAEYKCMVEDGNVMKHGLVTKKPFNTTFYEAAAIPSGALTALGIIRKAKIGKNKKVLIYGASGSVGAYAVQLSRYYGAQVTGVCSTSNLEMVESLGADTVIDYTKNDFTRNGEKYDVIVDAVHKKSLSQCKKALNKNGIYISAHSSTIPNLEDLLFLKELVEAGNIKSVVDRCYTLDEIIEAHRYVDLGHKKGNVVIELI